MDQHSNSWRAEIDKSARSIELKLRNFTHFTLKLHSSKAESGKWVLYPPKTIQPYGEAQAACVCINAISSASVSFLYAVIGLGSPAPVLQFQAGNSPISGRFGTVSINAKEEKNFQITKQESDHSHYSVSWQITTTHPKPITASISSSNAATLVEPQKDQQEIKERVSANMSSIDREESTDQNQLANLPLTPHDASPSSPLIETNRSFSVIVKTFNDTSLEFELTSRTLDAGIWISPPPKMIRQAQKFEIVAAPSFSGLSGEVRYNCTTVNAAYCIKWVIPVHSTLKVGAGIIGPQPRNLDSELRINRSPDAFTMDVILFVEGTRLNSSIKKKKPIETVPSSSVTLSVFRLPLQVLVQREGRSNGVPWIVESICEWIVQHHTATSNLFKPGGNYAEIKRIKTFVDTNGRLFNSDSLGSSVWLDYSPSSVISVLKIFFRELPTSLIPSSALKEFLNFEPFDSPSSYAPTSVDSSLTGSNHSNSNSLHKAPTPASVAPKGNSDPQMFVDFINILPFEHGKTLQFLVNHLFQLWKAPDSVHTVDTLAVVFGPVIIPTKQSPIPTIATLVRFIKCFESIRWPSSGSSFVVN